VFLPLMNLYTNRFRKRIIGLLLFVYIGSEQASALAPIKQLRVEGDLKECSRL
jgi:hypothetical protein